MPAPKLIPKKSSMAKAAHYDPATRTLTVQFTSGDTYRYADVPHNIGETVMGSASFGGSFNRHVAGRYKGTKL